jgi:hypothetical protein
MRKQGWQMPAASALIRRKLAPVAALDSGFAAKRRAPE